MKKLFYRLAVCLCVIGGLVGCSKDDEPGGGEGAMYQVTVQQSGDYRSYIKSVVVAANGTSVINENTNEKFKGTAILDDDALAVPSVTLSTEGSAIEFAVSGGVVDGDDVVVFLFSISHLMCPLMARCFKPVRFTGERIVYPKSVIRISVS